ncbi:MAG: hypothetical protein U5K43_11420 [Halofilum sp. (in: g-proteobacteria)]|nr:hypothetical protein [Halofilum sp. (in: g-proteobacteria)]
MPAEPTGCGRDRAPGGRLAGRGASGPLLPASATAAGRAAPIAPTRSAALALVRALGIDPPRRPRPARCAGSRPAPLPHAPGGRHAGCDWYDDSKGTNVRRDGRPRSTGTGAAGGADRRRSGEGATFGAAGSGAASGAARWS